MSIINKIAQTKSLMIVIVKIKEQKLIKLNSAKFTILYRKPGKKLITKMKKHIRKTLPENVQTIVTYQNKKLSTKLNVKDKTEFYHQSNSVYYGKCPNQTCTEDYIGETDCRIKERSND